MVDKVKESFLTMFKMIDPNRKYYPVKLALFYHIISEHLLEFPISIASSNIDMRFSFGCCITSGFGKGALKSVIIETAKETNKKYSTITSLQEEQLIGKKWYDKIKREDREIKGYFNDDFIIKDDALSLINSDKFEMARTYILTALDFYGSNPICKKLVEEEIGLEYNARCSLLYFIQTSEKIRIENLLSGLFRRAPIIRIDLTKEEIKEIIDKRLTEKYEPKQEDWFNFLRNLRNITNITYKGIDKRLLEKVNKIVNSYYTRDHLLETLQVNNQNTIIKFAYINTLLRLNPYKPYNPKVDLDISEEDLNKALDDYALIYNGIKRFVEYNKQEITISEHKIEQTILSLLRYKKCFSQETSNLSSSEIIELIAKKLNAKESTIRYHFYKLRKEGKIKTQQVGKNDSKVWLG